MTTPLDDLASALQCTLFPVQVLIVDDDPGSRGAMQRVLERQGYSVVVAGSGPEALGLLEGTHVPVDLLITDVQMPGLPGDALVEQVRESWPELPVLFVSGEPAFASLPQSAGGRARFLLKPFGQEELLAGVFRLLAQASSVAPSPEVSQPAPVNRAPVLL
jgi:CheY-like chemotaxis protein